MNHDEMTQRDRETAGLTAVSLLLVALLVALCLYACPVDLS